MRLTLTNGKKTRVELMRNKKNIENEFFSGKRKKDKKKSKPKNERKAEPIVLQHTLNILNYFDSIKIPPPLVSTALDETIKALQDRKNYFAMLSEQERGKQVEKKDNNEEKKSEQDKVK